MEFLFIVGRVLVGGYFMQAGYNHFKHVKMLAGYAGSKGVPMPREAVLLTGLMMFLGGLGVLLGVYVTYSIYLLVVFLLVTTFMMHNFWKVTDQNMRMSEEINFKKNLALMGALLLMLAIPLPWAVALF